VADNRYNPNAGFAPNDDDSPAGSTLNGPGASDESAAAEMDRLRADLREASDRVLRAQADFDNYRKRARRELDEEQRYANLALVRDLLPAVDNIQRAIAAAEKTPDASNLLDGIKLVAQGLTGTFARHHCTRIEALHKPFDPAFHEAIAQQPSDQYPPHTVVAVAQDGYVLHDRVVRPAQVVVSTEPSS
jgi:molecular chaperone GrpE